MSQEERAHRLKYSRALRGLTLAQPPLASRVPGERTRGLETAHLESLILGPAARRAQCAAQPVHPAPGHRGGGRGGGGGPTPPTPRRTTQKSGHVAPLQANGTCAVVTRGQQLEPWVWGHMAPGPSRRDRPALGSGQPQPQAPQWEPRPLGRLCPATRPHPAPLGAPTPEPRVCLPASREVLHVFPLVSGCQAPKEGDPVVLACLARGYSRESVQVTSVSEKQDQAKKTNLFIPKTQDNTELSFLTAHWKPDPHQCSTASGKLQKAFRWPGGWPRDHKEGPPGSPTPSARA